MRSGGDGAQVRAVAYRRAGFRIAGAERKHRRHRDRRRPGHTLVQRADHSERRDGAAGSCGIEPREERDERAVRQHDELIVDRLIGGAGIEDCPGCLPRRSTVARAREPGRAVALRREPIPHRVGEARVGRIGGHRLLVVEEVRPVADQRDRSGPRDPSVGRAADQHRIGRARGERRAVERDGDLVRGAIGREGHPRIGRAGVVAAVDRVAACAARERRHSLRPRASAVERHAGQLPACAAVGPAILLPDADEIRRVARVDGNKRLHLGVDVQRARCRRAIATGGEWREIRRAVLRIGQCRVAGRRRRRRAAGRRRTAATPTAARREHERAAQSKGQQRRLRSGLRTYRRRLDLHAVNAP